MSDDRPTTDAPADLPPPTSRAVEVRVLVAISAIGIAVTSYVYRSATIYLQLDRWPPYDWVGWLWVSITPLAVLATTLLLVGGVLHLLARPAGRVTLRAYAVLALLLIVPATVVRLARFRDFLADQRRQADLDDTIEVPASADWVGVPLTLLFALALAVYPLFLLYQTRRRDDAG